MQAVHLGRRQGAGEAVRLGLGGVADDEGLGRLGGGMDVDEDVEGGERRSQLEHASIVRPVEIDAVFSEHLIVEKQPVQVVLQITDATRCCSHGIGMTDDQMDLAAGRPAESFGELPKADTRGLVPMQHAEQSDHRSGFVATKHPHAPDRGGVAEIEQLRHRCHRQNHPRQNERCWLTSSYRWQLSTVGYSDAISFAKAALSSR